MSYQLAVFLPASPSPEAITGYVRHLPGLDVDQGSLEATQPATLLVVRGRRREYCFTIDGPHMVEPEDVPDEITACQLGAKYLYEIGVEGSSATSVPIAMRFAKRLAREARGAMLDAQTGQTWPKSSGRQIDRPTRGVTADTVQLHWYMLADEMPSDLPQLYLDLSRKYLPEALPRRYGTTEPFQGKLERDGDQGFAGAYESQPDDMLFMYCTYPVPYGYMLGRSMHRNGDVRSIKLEMDRRVLFEPRWRDAARRFFIEFAEQSKSFFGAAEVLRNHTWDGRNFRSGSTGEKPDPLDTRGQWAGLPNYPQWWTWYSHLYTDAVTPYFRGTIEKSRTGFFMPGPMSRQTAIPFANYTALRTVDPRPTSPRHTTRMGGYSGLHGRCRAGLQNLVPRHRTRSPVGDPGRARVQLVPSYTLAMKSLRVHTWHEP